MCDHEGDRQAEVQRYRVVDGREGSPVRALDVAPHVAERVRAVRSAHVVGDAGCVHVLGDVLHGEDGYRGPGARNALHCFTDEDELPFVVPTAYRTTVFDGRDAGWICLEPYSEAAPPEGPRAISRTDGRWVEHELRPDACDLARPISSG